jgi:hypothetical protein
MKHASFLFLIIGIALLPACKKSVPPQEDLPERYLFCSEMHAVSVTTLMLNSHPGYYMTFELSSEAADRMEALQWERLPERPKVTIIGRSERVDVPRIWWIESRFIYPCSFLCDEIRYNDKPFHASLDGKSPLNCPPDLSLFI